MYKHFCFKGTPNFTDF